MSDNENKLLSDTHAAFLDALQTLYIRNNRGGRIQFAREWPAAGLYVLGEELLRFDAEGTSDLERRAVLEGEAEERRLEIEEIVVSAEQKSVDKGVLQLEYVGPLVQRLGRDLSLSFYAPRIVDRFIPPPALPPVPAQEDSRPAAPSAPVQVPPPPTSMDDIRPISVDPAPPPAAAAPPQAPAAAEVPSVTVAQPAPVAAPPPPPVVPFAPAGAAQAIKPVVPKTEEEPGGNAGESQT